MKEIEIKAKAQFLVGSDACEVALEIKQSALGELSVFGQPVILRTLPSAMVHGERVAPVSLAALEGEAIQVSAPKLYQRSITVPSEAFEIGGGPIEVSGRELARDEFVDVEYYLAGAVFSTQGQNNDTFAVAGTRVSLKPLVRDVTLDAVAEDRRYSIPSACLEVRGVRFERLQGVDDLTQKLCWLMTYACGNVVSVLRRTVSKDGVTAHVLLRGSGPRRHGEPTPLRVEQNGGRLHGFLAHAYATFEDAARYYPVARLIHVVTLARSEPVLEVKAMILCTFMEISRYHHKTRLGRKKGSFCDLLTDFVGCLGLSGVPIGRFVKVRNSVVHEGVVPGATIFDRMASVNELLHFADMALLALFGWHETAGNYVPAHTTRLGSNGSTLPEERPFTRVWTTTAKP